MAQKISTELIEGVKVKPLKVIADDRGKLMEILRSDDLIFEKFGQVYVTICKPKVVKGWHYHKVQIDHFVCLQGTAKVVLYDARKDSRTHGQINEFTLSWEDQKLVKIPTYVYHGFTALGNQDAMILNIPTEAYRHADPDEFRADLFSGEIPYDWGDIDWKVSH